MIAVSLFGHNLRRMKVRKEDFTPWSPSDRRSTHVFHCFPGVLRGDGRKPSVFRDPEPPKALLPSSRRRIEEVEPLITPRCVVRMYHERAERRKGECE